MFESSAIIHALFIFIFGFLLVSILAPFLNIKRYFAILLYIWHTFFCIVYLDHVVSLGGLDDGYYSNAVLQPFDFYWGGKFVSYIVSIFIELNISYIAIFLVFNLFGSIGLLLFAGSLNTIAPINDRIIRLSMILILFLPSMSFWSSAISKDALAFLATTLFLWSSLNYKKRFLLLACSVLLMFMVRPHISVILVISMLSGFLLSSRTSILSKISLLMLMVLPLAYIAPKAFAFVELTDLSLNGILSYIEQRQNVNLTGSGALEIQEQSFVITVIGYLFYPFFFNAKNYMMIVVSIENLILLLLFIGGLYSVIRLSFVKRYKTLGTSFFLNSAIVYVLIILPALALITANMGIIVRQKWMFFPQLLLIIYFYIIKWRLISGWQRSRISL